MFVLQGCNNRGVSTRSHHDSHIDGVVAELLALARALTGLMASSLAELRTELTLPQHRLLVFLASRGPQRSTAVATELGIHPSTMSRNADRLVRRGLIRRVEGVDRRVVHLALTDEGQDLVGQLMRRRATAVRHLVIAAGTDNSDDISLLSRIVAAAGEPSEEEFWQRWARSTEPPDHARTDTD